MAALLSGGKTTWAEAGEQESENIVLTFYQEIADPEEREQDVFSRLIDAYTERKGVKIRWKTFGEETYREEVENAFANGEGPDVYVGELSDMSADFKKGRLHNFLYLYDQKNPYDPGEAWAEGLSDYLADAMHITENEVPGYPSQTSVVRLLCNQSLFEKADAALPQSWADLRETCERLTACGVTPIAFPNASQEEPAWRWLVNSLGNQVNESLKGILDVNEKNRGYVELEELCKGVDKGLVDFESSGFLFPYRCLKELSAYWDGQSLTQEEALKRFAAGEAAMVLAEEDAMSLLSEAEFSIEALPFPAVTEETYAGAPGMSVLCQGEPETIYGIRASLKNEKERFEAAVDFVQYMTSREVQELLAKEFGRLPADRKAELPEELSGFAVTEESLSIPFFAGIDDEQRAELWTILNGYISGETKETQLPGKLAESYEGAVSGIMEKKGWSLVNNYGMPTASECTMCDP